jgi:hypothetical protein
MPQNRGSLEALINFLLCGTIHFHIIKHMASGSSNNKNAPSGGQNPPSDEGDHLCVNMVKSYIDVATLSRDYSSYQNVTCPESSPPPKTPFHIEKLEPMPIIWKGVLKHSL